MNLILKERHLLAHNKHNMATHIKIIKGTKAEDIVFVVEETGIINTEKIRYEDVTKQIAFLKEEIKNRNETMTKLKALKSDVDKLI